MTTGQTSESVIVAMTPVAKPLNGIKGPTQARSNADQSLAVPHVNVVASPHSTQQRSNAGAPVAQKQLITDWAGSSPRRAVPKMILVAPTWSATRPLGIRIERLESFATDALDESTLE